MTRLSTTCMICALSHGTGGSDSSASSRHQIQYWCSRGGQQGEGVLQDRVQVGGLAGRLPLPREREKIG